MSTARGDENHTVFDLFSASGSFMGSITLSEGVRLFDVRGSELVTVGEDADGYPRITVWTIH